MRPPLPSNIALSSRPLRRPSRAPLPLSIALALLAVPNPACDDGQDDPTDQGTLDEERAFTGVFRATPGDGGAALDVVVVGDEAVVARFDTFHIGNPQVFNAGDPYLTGLTRLGVNRWAAQVADIDFAESPTYPRDWPTGVTYQSIELAWDGARWRSSGPLEVELSPVRESFSGDYDAAGACERRFQNPEGATLYACQFPQTAETCSPGTGAEQTFWPNATCARLGYDFESSDLARQWYDSETSNVTPGEHGAWGDGTGGGSTGGTDGTGGTGGTDGTGEPALDWKNTWLFVQGDKAVMYRLARVKQDGDVLTFRVQYVVNRGDGIWCGSECGGYHVFGALQDLSLEWRVEFPAGFEVDTPPPGAAGAGEKVYELDLDLTVELHPGLRWDDATARAVTAQGVHYGLIAHCADDNSDGGSRCSAYDPQNVVVDDTAR